MKKILSTILVIAMMASTAITAFAASMSFEATTDKDSYKAGDTVVITVEPTGDTFASAGFRLDFDNTKFAYVSAENEGEGSVTFGPKNVKTYIKATYAGEANIEGALSDELLFTFTFTVKEGWDGTATFKMDQVGEGYVTDETGAELDVTPLDINVTVEKDAPAGPAYTVATESDVNAAVKGYYTKGFMATVAATEATTIGNIGFEISCAGKEAKASDSWKDISIFANASASFAINVINIPEEVEASDLTIAWNVDGVAYGETTAE